MKCGIVTFRAPSSFRSSFAFTCLMTSPLPGRCYWSNSPRLAIHFSKVSIDQCHSLKTTALCLPFIQARSDELKFSADRLYGKIAQREHPFRFKSVFVANESRRLRI